VCGKVESDQCSVLEKWEQGRAKPNPQAAALVLLVREYPDTLARLDALATL
jgi:putative transcriptional regulator